jgi:hypothetical protein
LALYWKVTCSATRGDQRRVRVNARRRIVFTLALVLLLGPGFGGVATASPVNRDCYAGSPYGGYYTGFPFSTGPLGWQVKASTDPIITVSTCWNDEYPGLPFWVDGMIFVTDRNKDVFAQACVVVVCAGVSNLLNKTTYGPEQLTFYPAHVCMWEPVSGRSSCNYQRVALGYSSTSPTHYTYYVDVMACPVPGYPLPYCPIDIHQPIPVG